LYGNSLAPVHAVLIEVDLAGDLGQRLVERRGVLGPGQCAETRNQAARAAWIVAARAHRLDVDSNHITLLRALDHDRAVLGIQERHPQFLARQILFRLNLPVECIARFDDHAVARRDTHDRGRVRSHRVVKRALPRFGELVGFADVTARNAACVHDRLFKPVHRGVPVER